VAELPLTFQVGDRHDDSDDPLQERCHALRLDLSGKPRRLWKPPLEMLRQPRAIDPARIGAGRWRERAQAVIIGATG
jgi:hypothetical protein